MDITSNATPEELDSPFYKVNKEFCSKFEQFIRERNGTAKGKYNSWSYAVLGTITDANLWTLKYKKATLPSGNLFLSSKYQGLLLLCEWETPSYKSLSTDFTIIRKTKLGVLLSFFSKTTNELKLNNKYIIKSKDQQEVLLSNLFKTLHPLFVRNEIYKITLRSNKLKIELRTGNHYFEIFDQLIR